MAEVPPPPSSSPQDEQNLSQLDLGISLALYAWPALALAVQSSWGGPQSSDKRDWICGAISDLLRDRPDTDAEDLEEVLVQVMNDEFEVVVDDDSAAAVAEEIMQMRGQTARGEFGDIQARWQKWKTKTNGRDGASLFRKVEARDEDQETDDDDDGDGDDDDDDDDEEEEDVDMAEAPSLVRTSRPKLEPEVDESGFTKVVGRRKR
jgi:pre-rRNA-processing protein TSR2